MTKAQLFQWVKFNQDIPDTLVKKGDKGVIIEHLESTQPDQENGYIVEVFKEGKTTDVVSIPVSSVTPFLEIWGQKRLSGV